MGHDCSLCEYEAGCFFPLKLLNKMARICRQGRLRKGMRQTGRDQTRLPQVTDGGIVQEVP